MHVRNAQYQKGIVHSGSCQALLVHLMCCSVPSLSELVKMFCVRDDVTAACSYAGHFSAVSVFIKQRLRALLVACPKGGPCSTGQPASWRQDCTSRVIVVHECPSPGVGFVMWWCIPPFSPSGIRVSVLCEFLSIGLAMHLSKSFDNAYCSGHMGF